MPSTRHKSTQEPPIDLPVGFNAWLLDCSPIAGCATCQSEWRKLNACRKRGDIAQAARHATGVRDHAGGGH
jgi:alkylhydroperoxidase family enzyme